MKSLILVLAITLCTSAMSKAEADKASLVCKSFCEQGVERIKFFQKGIELGSKKSATFFNKKCLR